MNAFINNLDTLQYFFEESRKGNGISRLCYMIFNGRKVINPSAFSKNIKILAQEVWNAGPVIWRQEQISKERFLINNVLDDIKSPKNKDEKIISDLHLFEPLLQFYFRVLTKCTASGKSLMCLLKKKIYSLLKNGVRLLKSLYKQVMLKY